MPTSEPFSAELASGPRSVVVFLAPRLRASLPQWLLHVRRDELIEGRLLDACDIFRWLVLASTQSQVPPKAPANILKQPWREGKIVASQPQAGRNPTNDKESGRLERGALFHGRGVDWPPMIRDQLTIAIVAFAISFVAITKVMLSLMDH